MTTASNDDGEQRLGARGRRTSNEHNYLLSHPTTHRHICSTPRCNVPLEFPVTVPAASFRDTPPNSLFSRPEYHIARLLPRRSLLHRWRTMEARKRTRVPGINHLLVRLRRGRKLEKGGRLAPRIMPSYPSTRQSCMRYKRVTWIANPQKLNPTIYTLSTTRTIHLNMQYFPLVGLLAALLSSAAAAHISNRYEFLTAYETTY